MAKEGALLTNVIGDCNGAKAPLAIKVDQLRNRELAIAKGGMDMEVCQNHCLKANMLVEKASVRKASRERRRLVRDRVLF